MNKEKLSALFALMVTGFVALAAEPKASDAATLFHLATGRVLFPALSTDDTLRAHCDVTKQALDPRAYRPEISRNFALLLEAMLVKDRDHRISSWSEVLKLCTDIESGQNLADRNPTIQSSIKLI